MSRSWRRTGAEGGRYQSLKERLLGWGALALHHRIGCLQGLAYGAGETPDWDGGWALLRGKE